MFSSSMSEERQVTSNKCHNKSQVDGQWHRMSQPHFTSFLHISPSLQVTELGGSGRGRLTAASRMQCPHITGLIMYETYRFISLVCTWYTNKTWYMNFVQWHESSITDNYKHHIIYSKKTFLKINDVLQGEIYVCLGEGTPFWIFGMGVQPAITKLAQQDLTM